MQQTIQITRDSLIYPDFQVCVIYLHSVLNNNSFYLRGINLLITEKLLNDQRTVYSKGTIITQFDFESSKTKIQNIGVRYEMFKHQLHLN